MIYQLVQRVGGEERGCVAGTPNDPEVLLILIFSDSYVL